MARGVGERLIEGGDLWRDGYYSRNYSISFIVYYSIILMRSLAYFYLKYCTLLRTREMGKTNN